MDHLSSRSDVLIYDLLEDYWFFENLFSRRSRGLRYCHSDPYPSSTLTSVENMGDLEEEEKILETSTPSREDGSQTKLMRQISEKIRVDEPRQLGSFLQEKEQHVVLPKSGSRSAPGKIQEGSTKRGLTRTPSLPHQIEKREVDREAKKMISKLTRQFSEKIRILEPTRPTGRSLQKKETVVRDRWMNERNKTRGSYSSSSSSSSSVKIGLQRTQTMPHTMEREEEDEFEDQESDSRMGFLIREALASSHNVPKRPPKSLRSENTVMVKQESSSPKTLRKTLSSIETTKEIQRLKGYDDADHQLVVRGVATPPPRVPKDSRKEMKDQIKFWARAVASNVRQEC